MRRFSKYLNTNIYFHEPFDYKLFSGKFISHKIINAMGERRTEVAKTESIEESVDRSKESVELLKNDQSLIEIQSEIISLNN